MVAVVVALGVMAAVAVGVVAAMVAKFEARGREVRNVDWDLDMRWQYAKYICLCEVGLLPVVSVLLSL